MTESEPKERVVNGPSKGIVRIKPEILKKFMIDTFVGLDVPKKHAKIISDVLITSDLRGIDSHGIPPPVRREGRPLPLHRRSGPQSL